MKSREFEHRFAAAVRTAFFLRDGTLLSFHLLDFTIKTGVIVAVFDYDLTGLDESSRLSMKSDSHIANLGKPKMLSLYGKPALRVGKRVVSTFRLESRVACFPAGFVATKNGLVRLIQLFHHILKNLGVDVFKLEYVLYFSGIVAFCS
ncbi:hypothetical protein KP806_01520 [Paenibacillus sp. N4]|uniref:hypothetical protein n=1 Tax=Paenibacillus vietnamensis TaxID=2590547 RepID=UPI001CD0940D|nr:hypothetical protein [Paenibacillus vietnamensis]MCA0753713.1 hypothetical protein [Paenibacillus vietnamensis]